MFQERKQGMNVGQRFDIIRFTPDERMYYPSSMKRSSWMSDNYIKHTDLDIPLGHSRYGGPVVDLPKGVSYSKDLLFATQLDLAQFAPFDKSGVLPKHGQLIIFSDIIEKKGLVIYSEAPNEDLVRITREHDDHFFLGVLIRDVFSEEESFEERFRDPEAEWETPNEEGKVGDYFAGSEKSKVFGIYTDCQYERADIEEIVYSDKVLLLQVGEEGFNEEGVFSVLISREDLIQRRFDACEFSWSQS